ncbi:Hypothetical protein PHPALM_17544 [Phytophthora palmivora]|uniref:UBA domain-containing protein n=1 Tax=Phytophthora palmivora TaxID=4796 RepID=A0A2P4XM08_9STRA|nr:Hypothetical protein PHPALM_17544 [Phytophthora palmivora]
MLVLRQRQQCYRNGDAINQPQTQPNLEECFVLLRGQILADPDVVDLNALSSSDFFVFTPDVPQPACNLSSSGKMHKGRVDSATSEVLQSQLVDMGFSSELAAQALRQSGDNLSDAAALLAEGKIRAVDGGESMKSDKSDLVLHPSIAPLGSLVHDGKVRTLRELAAVDSFQALLLLKEHFSSDALNLLNENPLVEMGFARDLVKVMFESCGRDEQVTANALLQTLES